MALEYALEIPKSFWLNLQARYDAELLEYDEENTISVMFFKKVLKDFMNKEELIVELDISLYKKLLRKRLITYHPCQNNSN